MLLMPRENLFAAMGLFCAWLLIIKTPTPVFLEPGMGFQVFSWRVSFRSPRKQSTILRRYHCFSREMTSEKRAQKLHTDDVSLPRSGCASHWLKQISHAAWPIRSTTQIRVVTRLHYGISAFVSQMSFRGETSVSVGICRLFS